MKIRTVYKMLLLAPPLLLFSILQLLDQELSFHAITFWLFVILELAIACLVRPVSKKEFALYVVIFVSLWAIWRIPFTSRKAFLLDFQRVAAGDSLSDVQGTLRNYKLHIVADDGLNTVIYVLHAEDSNDEHGRYNADIGRVLLRHGIVTKREFLPD